MLSSITLRGVKSFDAETKVRWAPLTILTGSNSCGKSTLFQSILLVKQLVEVPAGSSIDLEVKKQ